VILSVAGQRMVVLPHQPAAYHPHRRDDGNEIAR
jgi:hypothetical protein